MRISEGANGSALQIPVAKSGKFRELHCSSAARRRSNPVSGHSLRKTGVFQLCAVERESSTWHDHVHVRMMGERRTPRCAAPQ